jgi:hypothetical protein
MAGDLKTLQEMLYADNTSFEKVATAFTVLSVAQPVEEINADFNITDAWDILLPESIDHDRFIVSKGNKTYGYVELYGGDIDYFDSALVDAYNKKYDLQGIDALDGFGELQNIEGVTISDCAQPINTLNIMTEATPIVELLDYFIKNEIAFILGKNNKFTHTITFADMDSIPIKMCLFALLLDLEVKMKELLEKQSNLDSYINMLPPNSVEKINKYAKRKYSHCKLITAQQMLEFTNINEKHCMIRDHLAKSSKSELEAFDPHVKKLQSLRNSIAHGEPLAFTMYTPIDIYEIILVALGLIKYCILSINSNGNK